MGIECHSNLDVILLLLCYIIMGIECHSMLDVILLLLCYIIMGIECHSIPIIMCHDYFSNSIRNQVSTDRVKVK